MQYLYLYSGNKADTSNYKDTERNFEILSFCSPNYLMPISYFKQNCAPKKLLSKAPQSLPIALILLAFI